jgi:hypothetical protein
MKNNYFQILLFVSFRIWYYCSANKKEKKVQLKSDARDSMQQE